MKNKGFKTSSTVTDTNDQNLDNTGIVYLLINEAMPGFVKIGVTTREDPQTRINELYNSSVPVPFECVLAVRVEYPSKVENALHKAFESNRINPKREFFQIDHQYPAAILELMITMGYEDVTPTVNEANSSIPENERKTSEILRSRRPQLNFKEMGISAGSTLYSIHGEETAEVIGERKVNFREQEMSLSKATKILCNINYNVGPCSHWIFKGRNLSEIYNETYLLDNH